MEIIRVVTVCEKCERVFANADMGASCPECGGDFAYGAVDSVIVEAFIAQDILSMLSDDDDVIDAITDALNEKGFDWNPENIGLDQLKQIQGR